MDAKLDHSMRTNIHQCQWKTLSSTKERIVPNQWILDIYSVLRPDLQP